MLSSAPVVHVLPNINLKETPIPYDGLDPSRQITLGDLHANGLRLVNTLIREGIFKQKPGGRSVDSLYQELQGAYYNRPDGYPNEETETDFYLKAIDLLDQFDVDIEACGLLRLIGDVLCDRGRSDAFVLKILEKLHHAGLNYTFMVGNHDASYLRVLMQNGFAVDPGIYPCPSYENIARNDSIKSEVFNTDFAKEIIFPHMKLIDYVLHDDGENKTISLFTHAPVGMEVIRGLCRHYRVEASDLDSVTGLAKAIDAINDAFQAGGIEKFHAANHPELQAYQSVAPDIVAGKKVSSFPIQRLIWNREHEDCDYELELKDGAKVHYTFGHNTGISRDPDQSFQQICIDNETGKEHFGDLNDTQPRLIQTQRDAGYPENECYLNYDIYEAIHEPTRFLFKIEILSDEQLCQLLETILSKTTISQRWRRLETFVKKMNPEHAARLDTILPGRVKLEALLGKAAFHSVSDMVKGLKNKPQSVFQRVISDLEKAVVLPEDELEFDSAYDGFIHYFHRENALKLERYFVGLMEQIDGGNLPRTDLLNLLHLCIDHKNWDRFYPIVALLGAPLEEDKDSVFSCLKIAVEKNAPLGAIALLMRHHGSFDEVMTEESEEIAEGDETPFEPDFFADFEVGVDDSPKLQLLKLAIKHKDESLTVLKYISKCISGNLSTKDQAELLEFIFEVMDYDDSVFKCILASGLIDSINSEVWVGEKRLPIFLALYAHGASSEVIELAFGLLKDHQKKSLMAKAVTSALIDSDIIKIRALPLFFPGVMKSKSQFTGKMVIEDLLNSPKIDIVNFAIKSLSEFPENDRQSLLDKASVYASDKGREHILQRLTVEIDKFYKPAQPSSLSTPIYDTGLGHDSRVNRYKEGEKKEESL